MGRPRLSDDDEARIVRLLVEVYGHSRVAAVDDETRSIQRVRWLLSEVEGEHPEVEEMDLDEYAPNGGD